MRQWWQHCLLARSLTPSPPAPTQTRSRLADPPVGFLACPSCIITVFGIKSSSFASRPTDRHPAGLALGSHVGGNNRVLRRRVAGRQCADDTRGGERERERERERPKPKNCAANALVPGWPPPSVRLTDCLLAAYDVSFERDANEIPFSVQVLRCVRAALPSALACIQ